MKIAYIIGAGVIAIGGVAAYFINEWLKAKNPISHIEDEDIFDKATIKKWMNSLDLPEIEDFPNQKELIMKAIEITYNSL